MDRPFPAYKGDGPYIFVSYSHRDSASVFPELEWLKASGINVWYDEGIEAGTEWREELAKAIESARLLIYFVTSDSVNSENCRKEVNFAVDEGIPIIAIHLAPVDLPSGLKLTLSDRQAILKHEIPVNEYQQKLLMRISTYIDQEMVQPAPADQRKTTSIKTIIMGVAVVSVLAIGLFIYYQQRPVTNTAAVDETEISIPEPPRANTAEKTAENVDLTANRSIAVLPFANMTTSESTGFFADGLSEDILDQLTQIQGLNVASRSASFQFTERGEDPSMVGEKLKVAYLLEGSVRQQGDTVRITAQLIRTNDGFHVWSNSYERTLAGDFGMQTDIAYKIANVTSYKLRFDILKNYGRYQNPVFEQADPLAVEHFFKGMEEFGNARLGEQGDYAAALRYLENAVEVDPSFFPPYQVIASLYLQLHQQQGLLFYLVEAEKVVNKALLIKPDDLSIQSQHQRILLISLDYNRAEQGLRHQVQQFPKFGFALLMLADIAMREGNTNKALKLLDNISTFNQGVERGVFLSTLALVRTGTSDYEGALEANTEALKLLLDGPDRTEALLDHAFTLIFLDRVDEARPYLKEAWKQGRNINPERFIHLFARIGETEKAKSILANSRVELTNHYYLALGHLALGDVDNTFKAIEAGITNRNQFLPATLLVGEWFDPIRDDPRFDEMLELLDSGVTHTEQYLRDHNIGQQELQL